MDDDDVKISQLDALTSVEETDILPVVDDPSGTPATKKMTVKTLLDKRLNFTIVPAGDFTLAASTAAQAAFPTAGDVFTLAAETTYEFEGQYRITKSGTTCTIALLFSLAGGASITSILYHALSHNLAVNTSGASQDSVHVAQVSATVVGSTSTGEVFIRIKGLIRMNTGGTVTPQIQFSAVPTTPVMKADSYLKFTPIGTNTENQKGIIA